MRESHTAILERHARLDARHATEPYECGWANQASFFVYATQPGPRVELIVESSADGQRWVPHGTFAALEQGADGTRVPVEHIDGWLRLQLRGAGDEIEYDVYLCLKE